MPTRYILVTLHYSCKKFCRPALLVIVSSFFCLYLQALVSNAEEAILSKNLVLCLPWILVASIWCLHLIISWVQKIILLFRLLFARFYLWKMGLLVYKEENKAFSFTLYCLSGFMSCPFCSFIFIYLFIFLNVGAHLAAILNHHILLIITVLILWSLDLGTHVLNLC